nr:FUN14 domain-containing protein 2 isoform X3 [Kogia breviceps]
MVCLLALVLEGPYVENRLQGAKWRPGNQRRSSNSDGAESQSLVPSGHSGLTRGHGFAHFTRSSQGCPLPAAISLSYRRPESLLYPFLCSSILHSVAESSCKHTAWELKGFAQDHEMKCTGFIFQKVGRLAATALGGGFFLLQVCRQPYRLHQSGLAAGREGREESQGAAEDPQQQPDTYGGQKQSRGGGVVCEEECSSDWWIFRRLSAWYGILKRMTSLPYSWLFQPAAFHSIIG